MNSSLKQILTTVSVEAVYVVPQWKLIDATTYSNAAKGMFDEVFQGWGELKEQGKYGLTEDSTLAISESTSGNNRVYILMRKEQIISRGESA